MAQLQNVWEQLPTADVVTLVSGSCINPRVKDQMSSIQRIYFNFQVDSHLLVASPFII